MIFRKCNDMIIFRTDANDEIATGHIMRCITVAKEIKNKGVGVLFAVSDKLSGKLAEKEGFEVVCLETDWRHLDYIRESDILCRYGKNLIIDTYSATSEYIENMSKYFRITAFDDMFEIFYNVDILINYNIYYEKFDYLNRYKGRDTELLLGTEYVPIRKQFIEKTFQRDPVLKNKNISIMLICGGGDILNTMGQIVEYISGKNINFFTKLKWNIVLGSYNKYRDKILEISKRYCNITIYENITDIENVMENSDICISAASTVLYESCVMKLPTIFFCVAENQKYDAEYFEKKGMIYAGDFRGGSEVVCTKIYNAIKKLISDKHIYSDMIDKMTQITDGKGAERIADKILTTI